MKNWKSIVGSTAIVTLMSSTATFADVSAAEVWADWQDYLTGFGYTIDANETTSGDSLTINGLSIALELPDDGEAVKINLGTLTFTNQGNGTVAVVMPDHMPMSITATDEFVMALDYDTKGMSMVVSGSADNMTYDYSADEAAFRVSELMIEGDKFIDPKIELVFSNLAGKSTSAMKDIRNITQAMSVDKAAYDIAVSKPGDDSSAMMIKGEISDLALNSESAIPEKTDFEDLSKALAAGFSGEGSFTWGAGGYEFTTENDGTKVTGRSASDKGNLDFGLDRNSVHYGATAMGTNASFTSSDLPFPVELSIVESAFNMLMPINKSDTPSDYAMTIKLGDLTVNDAVWGMIDPGSVLSRDPATVLLDLSGKANWLFDIMNPDAADEFDGEAPAQLHELTLKSLQVKAAGADLTGSGAFTFNNDDLETFDGLPAPTGALDLKLVGGNGLMDNLVKMGLPPEDQAMGARMMMGLFAVVGEGDDTLTSKIEVTGDGHVLANGQRLK